MIDACGWELVKDRPFAQSFASTRKRLASVFGYSSACVPSIVSGRWPCDHRNWCYFVYDPAGSPFKWLEPLHRLPRALSNRRIVRRWLSKWVQARLKFCGYFDLYNVPFEHIGLFDFTEKKSPLQPGGMNRGENIFDVLEQHGTPYYVSDPSRSETDNLNGLSRRIEAEGIDFAFMYWPGLDGLLHRVGNQAPEISTKLRTYESWITHLLSVARKHYREIHLYVFSDHGMANCEAVLDLQSKINALGLFMGQDYAAVYDSTMARFWFFDEVARREITGCLRQTPQGRIIPDAELKEMGVFFPDRYFGELIFLVKEGVLIVPSHMGERPLAAMHGYHPSEKESYAALMTNQEAIPETVAAIPDIFQLMTSEAELAARANHPVRALIPRDENDETEKVLAYGKA